jgi:hypothetical protein
MRAVRHRRRQERVAVAILLVLALAVFGGGLTWGLPSRDADRFLFGSRPAWSGRQIMELTGKRATASTQGADVDRDPLRNRAGKVLLNRTDRDRAEIVRRYRLFTYQPDEMVTMMALAEMHPGQGDFDPKLYQYGGLWVYPIGGLLKLASVLHLARVTPNLERYLDYPAEFGRFYVIARLYVVAWAMLGAWAVFALTRRFSGGSLLAACMACFCYIMLPVVVNMVHEAKPHLPGAVLMLLAVLAMSRYVRTAERRWWFAGAVLSGMAVGMVLAAWPVLVLPPVASLLIRQEWRARLRIGLGGVAIAVVVYFATNPYVLIHLFNNRELLRSNLGNTRGMFELGLSGSAIVNAARLVGQGASVGLAGVGAIVTLVFLLAALVRRHSVARHAGWLLVVPMLLLLAQFTLFAGGQAAEYGRFAIFADVCLIIAAVVGGWHLLDRLEWRPEVIVVLGLAAAIPGSRYYAGFVSDAIGPTSRTMTSELLEAKRQRGARTLGVVAEPAPYAVPAVDLFHWHIVLLPKDYDPERDTNRPDVIVRTFDGSVTTPASWAVRYRSQAVDPLPGSSDMSWAGKPFAVFQLAGE